MGKLRPSAKDVHRATQIPHLTLFTHNYSPLETTQYWLKRQWVGDRGFWGHSSVIWVGRLSTQPEPRSATVLCLWGTVERGVLVPFPCAQGIRGPAVHKAIFHPPTTQGSDGGWGWGWAFV